MRYKPKKSLGQNFLKSEMALKKIVEAGEINPNDVILEIGPGKGALTRKLLEKAGQVIAVEKDDKLFELLKEKFKKEIGLGSLVLVHDDILKLSMTNKQPARSAGGFPKSYKVVANIPYNITGAILKKFLSAEHQPERMALMVQHEVAKRIMASDKKESILSISVKTYGEPKFIMKVPAREFSPAPKVNSAIIAIKNISRRFFEENKINEEKFWEIVKKGFAHKRKKLSSNLKNLLKRTENSHVEKLGNKRAEDLALSDWILLAK